MTDTSPGWALGIVTGNTFDMKVSLSEDEFASYHESASAVASLSSQFTFGLVSRNYHDLKNLLQYLGIVIATGRAIGTIDTIRVAEPVMGQIVNWLTSVRLYLDHTETHLKRTYGDSSAEWASFSRSCAEAYDNHFGYRFVYRFRNYVQHCGLPVSSITVSRPERTRSPHHIQDAVFLLDRNALLAAFDGWGPVKADLQGMTERFEVFPLMDDAMECLRGIERRRLEGAVAAAASHATVLLDALARIGDLSDGTAALFAFTVAEDQSVTSLSPTPLPTKAALEVLDRVSAGEQDPGSLIESAIPPRPPLDPTTIRERLRADSRGVQVLSLFLEQGGSTPEFFRGIDAMVRGDGDVRVLVAGLVNVSVILLHAAASAVGASARGFLSGMLDVYSQFGALDEDSQG